MAKSSKRISRSFILLIIVYIIAIFSLTTRTIKNISIYKTKTKENFSLKEELNDTNDIYNINKQEEKILKDKISTVNNLDNNIKESKESVFNKAKELEKLIIDHKSNAKIAYLTFDDGPYYLTNTYLRILKENKVKATFFTIGLDKDICYDSQNQDCSNMYKKIVDSGHTIANHTYSHLIRNGLYSSTSSFMYQVKLQEDLIKKRTGVITNIVRFPGGSGTSGSLKNSIINELRKNHYGWVDWTAQDGDGGGVSSTDAAWNIFYSSVNENIEVVLLHDYSYTTVTMLPDIIKYLKNKNYILLPLFYDSAAINK